MSDDDKTVWCGNLSENATEEVLYELFVQAGPLEKVNIPKAKDTGRQRNYAFIMFKHVESVPYTIQLLNGIQLYGRSIRLQHRSGSVHDKSGQSASPRHNQSPRNSSQQNADNAGELHRSNTWPKIDGGDPSEEKSRSNHGQRYEDRHQRRDSRDEQTRDQRSFNSPQISAGGNYVDFSRNDNFQMPPHMSRAFEEERRAHVLRQQQMQLLAYQQMQQGYHSRNYSHGQQQAFRGKRW